MKEKFTVLELGDGIASGFCGRLLAGTGGQVIKVEPQSGSCLRIPQNNEPFASAFEYLAMYKKSITPLLDTNGLPPTEILMLADIIIEEFDSDLTKAHQRIDELQSKNPHAVIVVCSPFGLTGPYAKFSSSSIVDWAMSGYASITGEPSREPLQGGGPWCAYVGGATAAIGALAALRNKVSLNQSEIVDVATFESMAALHQWSIVLHTHQGVTKQRSGNYHAESHHPLGLFPCKDGWVSIAVSLAQQWENFCLAIDQPELLSNPKFRSGGLRFDNAQELDTLIIPWLKNHGMDEIVEQLQKWSVPASPVLDIYQVIEDIQLKQRDFWVNRDDIGKNVRAPSLPVTLLNRPDGPPLTPNLGQHNLDINKQVKTKSNHPSYQSKSLSQKNDLPLAGIRVLELSIAWAGPLTGRFLADLGADVIRIEHRNSRGIGIPPGGFEELALQETSSSWQWGDLAPPDIRSGIYPDADLGEKPWNRQGTLNKIHRNKRSLCLDLKTEKGKAIFHSLSKGADIVVNNYRPRALERLGLTYKELQTTNTDIICMTMSGYGATGPFRDRASFGPVLEAHSGLAMLTGYDEGVPYKFGAAFPDGVAGLIGAFALLDALHERDRTGLGQDIDLSQLETYLSIAGEKIIESSYHEKAPPMIGNRSKMFAPQGIYRCKGHDNWVAITISNDHLWGNFIQLLNDPDLNNESYQDMDERHRHHDLIDAAITRWTATRDKFEVMQKLQKLEIPSGAVLSNADLVNNPHLRARKFIVAINQTDVGVREFPGFPIHFKNIPQIQFQTAPALGADNKEILQDLLGFTDVEYQELINERIIAEQPDNSPT